MPADPWANTMAEPSTWHDLVGELQRDQPMKQVRAGWE